MAPHWSDSICSNHSTRCCCWYPNPWRTALPASIQPINRSLWPWERPCRCTDGWPIRPLIPVQKPCVRMWRPNQSHFSAFSDVWNGLFQRPPQAFCPPFFQRFIFWRPWVHMLPHLPRLIPCSIRVYDCLPWRSQVWIKYRWNRGNAHILRGLELGP